MNRLFPRLTLVLGAALVAPAAAFAQEAFKLVNIKTIAPTIVIDLRYASANNIAGKPLYPHQAQALTRPEVAQRLIAAHNFLRRYGYQLKIWDAYRPKEVQHLLWAASRNNDYVANPDAGAGSLHSWALAVDATLADTWNRPISMPTDFDDFTPAAMWKYMGTDPLVRQHLTLLQVAMRDAGFLGLRSEWWHFTIDDWQKFMPPEEAKKAQEAFGKKWQGEL